CFFFSSRRRHTRFSRDWSSDVCSSDLEPHFRPKAKAMISLFMMGGPSQMDLFDPKPMLNEYDGKNFPGEIKYDNLAQASSKVFEIGRASCRERESSSQGGATRTRAKVD